jgi:excisionase family DNA binding protein
MDLNDADQVNIERVARPHIRPLTGALSAREAARLLGVHERTIRRAIREGQVEATKRGRAYAITPESLHRYRSARGERPAGSTSERPTLTLLPPPKRPGDHQADASAPIGRARSKSIPQPLTSFVGREQDVATLLALLRQPSPRLLTLTGPGGVGKTRLAIAVATEIAAEYADGAWFVPLAAVSDPALVLSSIARALDVRETAGRPLAETLATALGDRRLLLVLDNFEHVLDASADISTLLEVCPNLTAFVTSRVPLRLSAEQRYLARPLSLPASSLAPSPESVAGSDAIALFLERARSVRHDFVLNADNAAPIVEICRRLDALPLAIELAAAWVRVLPPTALLERLGKRLPLLHGGPADLPDRLRTMRDAIAWSYDLLTADEARLFRWLGVFAGGFSLEAAEWVGGREPEAECENAQDNLRPSIPVLVLLTALVDKSLLQHVPTESGEPRFQMLETIREYALARLAESGEERPARDAHAAYCLAFAQRYAPDQFRDDDVVERVAALNAEHADLLAALAHFAATDADEAQVLLAALLGPFWFLRSLHSVGRACLERALARPTSRPAVDALAMAHLAQLAFFQGDHAIAAATLVQAEERAAAAGDRLALAFVRCRQATLVVLQGDCATGHALAAEAEKLARGADDALVAMARFLQARAIHYEGDLERAERLYWEILSDPPPPRYADATCRYSLAMIAHARGKDAEALGLFVAALPHFFALGDQWSVATCLEGVAISLSSLGHAPEVARLLGASTTLRSSIAAPMLPPDVADYERAVASVRSALGSGAFTSAWDAGSALAVEAAVAEAQAEAALALAAGKHPARTATTSRGLTSRERDVLRLLVAGLADKQIAATLAISRATVSRHVSTILAKLGAPSRGAATAIAIRDRLT